MELNWGHAHVTLGLFPDLNYRNFYTKLKPYEQVSIWSIVAIE